MKAAAVANSEQFYDVGGETNELHVWRVESFRAKPWPRFKWGQFHSGDSYLVLETSKGSDGGWKHDIHVWVRIA